jgi:hypothetical protein
VLLSLLLLLGCELTPPNVENSDIDDALVYGRWKTVCKGLEMTDDHVRTYATEKLEESDYEGAADCVCARAIDARTGRFDVYILNGLRDSTRDDMVGCFLPALDAPETGEELTALVVALAETDAPSARAKLKAFAADAGRPSEGRVRAVAYFTGTTDDEILHMLMMLLQADSDPAVRAAAADALSGQKDADIVGALVEAAKSDDAGGVRARALVALKKSKVPEYDEMVCRAMMEDESAEVREQAVLNYRGTKRKEAIACVAERAMKKEESGEVRAAILKVLGSSPTDEAAKALCDAIPFWVQTYVDKVHPDKQPENDVITAQNNRDWENSYECVGRAYAQSHLYTCKGQQYVGAWWRELGNKSAFVPKCDEGGAAEITMEGAEI